MSTHTVKIIEITEVRPHPNADRLEIVPVGGWSAVVGKGQFTPGSRGVYIEPDYVVPLTREEFAFLAKGNPEKIEHRLKAARLRGVLSFGLLIPVPEFLESLPTGADVMELLDIRRWEPPIKSFAPGKDDTLARDLWPQLYTPKFDLENIQNFPGIFQPGENVLVTEKLHGSNGKCVFHNGQFYVGTRNRWVQTSERSLHTRAMMTPEIMKWCEENPDVILYGEVYGPVQELRYGLSEPRFAVFAGLWGDGWLGLDDLFRGLKNFGHNVEHVPILHRGPFDWEKIAPLAELDTTITTAPKGHMREGLVIVPEFERMDPTLGRVALKLISNRYWES